MYKDVPFEGVHVLERKFILNLRTILVTLVM